MITAADLPLDKRGVTWFWHLLQEGESGAELARRLPDPSEKVTANHIVTWTKVTGEPATSGKPAWYIILLREGKNTAVVSIHDTPKIAHMTLAPARGDLTPRNRADDHPLALLEAV